MVNNPLVSIIMPTFKRSSMLERAIDSALKQTYANIEVIVVDDNDPDTEWRRHNVDFMKRYETNDRVRYICHERNMNGSVARNTGIENAKGSIVTFLDDDDWYYPEKVEKQVKYLLTHHEYRAVYCGWNRDGQDIIPTYSDDMAYGYLSGTNIIITNSIMMWRKDAIECGGFDPAFKRHQEAVFMLRFLRFGGKVGCLPEILVGFDVSDRTNEPTPAKDEEYNFQYLNAFQDLIDKCEKHRKGSRKEIYVRRLRVVFIKYVKYKKYKEAILLFRKMLKVAPVMFTGNIVTYAVNRVFRSK